MFVGGVQWQRTLGFLFSALGWAFQGRSVSVCFTFSTIFSFFLSHSRFTRIQIFLLFLAFVWSWSCRWCLRRCDSKSEKWLRRLVTFFVTIKHSSCRQPCKVLLITDPLHPQTPAPPAYCLSVLFAAWFGLPQWLFLLISSFIIFRFNKLSEIILLFQELLRLTWIIQILTF